MSGPEHYAEAERLLALNAGRRGDISEPNVLKSAHVHALLAVAAATALATPDVREPSFEDQAWLRVAGTQRRPA